jgi:hypothetical protein
MSDELETLRAWAPPEEMRDEGAARARARMRLDAHIAGAPPAAPALAPPAAAPSGPRPRRRWWLVAAPGAMAAAVGAAILLSLGSGVQEGRVAPAPATAADALERAATAATRKPAPEPFPRPAQFFYTRTQATYLDVAVANGPITVPSLNTRTREAWISLGRRGGERTIATKQRFPSAAARAAWVKAGRFDLGSSDGKSMTSLGKTTYYLGNERLSYLQLLAFNQSGPALYQRLRAHYREGQGGGIDDEIFTQVGDALREQASPPRLRAALYRALKEVPGVRYLGRVRDRLGRPAIGIGRTTNRGTQRELLFDPGTSAMLAEREVMIDVPKGLVGLVPPGTVSSDAVYERRAVVDRLGQRP